MTDKAYVQPLADRSCGKCMLCCKLPEIDDPDLKKPALQWCSHCSPGKGCQIYDRRPQTCRDYFCLWITHPGFGPEWYPPKSKMMLTQEAGGMRLAIHVDPGFPDAWRKQPYYAMIKQMAADQANSRRQLIVYTGKKATIVLPDKEVDFYDYASDDRFITKWTTTAAGVEWSATVVRGKVARSAG